MALPSRRPSRLQVQDPSRRLAALGARVVACDFSAKFIELARGRTLENAERIAYHVVDATDEAQLLSLAVGRYDAVVCTMGIMDMPAVDPLMSAVRQLLRPGGRFVFSVMHPCFNTEDVRKYVEEEDRAGKMFYNRGIRLTRYKSVRLSKGLGIRTQPVPSYYFMRTLSALCTSAFRVGLVMDGLEEPAFPATEAAAKPALDWSSFPEIPPVLIARFRR